MNILAISDPIRWLVLPATVIGLVVAPPGVGLLGAGLLLATLIVGLAEQGVRLGDIGPRVRWASSALAVAVWVVVFVAKLEWVMSAGSYLVVVLFGLSGMSGLLLGAFLASLWSKQVTSGAAITRGSDETKFSGVLGRLSRADDLTVLRTRSTPTAATQGADQLAEPQAVEAFVDGRWRRATLASWETRDLALYGRVSLDDEPGVARWVDLDCVRVKQGAESEPEQ